MEYSLHEKQAAFARLIFRLTDWAFRNGYEVTLGEAFRDSRLARMYAKLGIGISSSLHTIRLAIDLQVFKDGKWLTDSKDYSPIGEYWESLSTPGLICCWGGRFSKPDGNHFSIEHKGIR